MINVEHATIIHIVLTSDEAQAIIDDAEPLQGELRLALYKPNGNGHKHPKPATAEPATRTQRTKTNGHRQTCPKCGKVTTPGRLITHIAKMHPELQPEPR